MTLVGANDVNVTFTLYDFAVFANLTNASADFHRGGLTFFNTVEFSKRISIWPVPAAPQGLIGVPRRLLFRRPEKRGFNRKTAANRPHPAALTPPGRGSPHFLRKSLQIGDFLSLRLAKFTACSGCSEFADYSKPNRDVGLRASRFSLPRAPISKKGVVLDAPSAA